MPSQELNSFLHYIDHWADQTPSSPAWWLEQQDSQFQPISWQELRFQLLDTISRFRSLNLPSDSRIVTCGRNSLQWVLIDLACQAMNWIHVPIDPRLSDSTKQNICTRVQPSLWVSETIDPKVGPKVRWDHSPVLMKPEPMALATGDRATKYVPIAPEARAYGSGKTRLSPDNLNCAANVPAPDSTATILFTSGSTSAPRGVKLSHRNLLANARAKLDAMPQLASDRRLNILPFSHAYARTCELSTWIISGSSMMTVSTIDKMLEVAPRFQPTLVNGVPYLFEKIQQRVLESKTMHRSAECPGSETEKQLLHEVLGTQLRMLAAGGAGLDESTFNWFASCGYPIYQGYGLTEAGPVVCSNRFPNPTSKYVGLPVLDTEVRVDANQRLHVRGPGVMIGYDDDEEATKDRIRDGWLDTGDLAERTADGAVRILGRGDDRITLPTGYKIDPAPVERKICKVLGVDHCLLVLSGSDRLLLIVPSNLPNPEPQALATGDRATTFVPISPEASAYGSGRTIANSSQQTGFSSSQTLVEPLRSLRDSIPDEPHYALPTELMIVENDWSQANGMLNAKGAIQRTRIRDRYLGGIK